VEAQVSTYHVTLTWNGVPAETPEGAVDGFRDLLGISIPPGTVFYVVNDETGEETEVEV
jgi:hypothetical protein